jgi:inosose dehydratase
MSHGLVATSQALRETTDSDPSTPGPLRSRLRRPGDALARASIGTVPILWNNVDIEELRLGTDAATILDEIARTGFEGTQLGLGFPEGSDLARELAARGLRLAEVYASLPATADGPTPDALAIGRERLGLLHAAGGDVLCVALDLSPGRREAAGRAGAAGTPRFSPAAWESLVTVIHDLAREAIALGHRVAFHPHAGTFIETPDEVAELVERTDPALLGICLDVGHYLVGGGDPVAALRALGPRVTHVHLKDVDPDVFARLRSGGLNGFTGAIRARLFTELGAGILDLPGVLEVLVGRDYAGWLMIEQDSCWGPPSESAAIGRRVLAEALHQLGRRRATA